MVFQVANQASNPPVRRRRDFKHVVRAELRVQVQAVANSRERRVVHLHRRAGFGATWGEIQRDLRDGPGRSVDRLLAGSAYSDGVPGDFEATAKLLGDSAISSSDASRFKAWWIYRMLFGPDPLTERLVLMWHNHFATSNLKVDNVALGRGRRSQGQSRSAGSRLQPRSLRGA